MKQKFLFLLAAVVALALGSCTIDDEIESVHTERLAGYWYSEVIRSGKTANLLTEDEGDMVRYDHVGAILYFNNGNNRTGYWATLYLQNGKVVNYEAPSNTGGKGGFSYSMESNGDINLSDYIDNEALGKLRSLRHKRGAIKANFSGMAVDFSRANTDLSALLEELLKISNNGQ